MLKVSFVLFAVVGFVVGYGTQQAADTSAAAGGHATYGAAGSSQPQAKYEAEDLSVENLSQEAGIVSGTYQYVLPNGGKKTVTYEPAPVGAAAAAAAPGVQQTVTGSYQVTYADGSKKVVTYEAPAVPAAAAYASAPATDAAPAQEAQAQPAAATYV